MNQGHLNFQAFQARFDAAFPNTEQAPGKAERRSLYVMLSGIALALLAGYLAIGSTIGKALILAGLGLELGGGLVHVLLAFRRFRKDLRFDDRSGAKEFEQDFQGYQQIIAWLRSFPQDQLQTRLSFISHRLEGWQRGTLFVLGSVEKLGILPIVVALFVQFKDTELAWPPDITLIGGLLTFAVVMIYVIGFLASMRKMQAGRFERFLKLALDSNFKISDEYSDIALT